MGSKVNFLWDITPILNQICILGKIVIGLASTFWATSYCQEPPYGCQWKDGNLECGKSGLKEYRTGTRLVPLRQCMYGIFYSIVTKWWLVSWMVLSSTIQKAFRWCVFSCISGIWLLSLFTAIARLQFTMVPYVCSVCTLKIFQTCYSFIIWLSIMNLEPSSKNCCFH